MVSQTILLKWQTYYVRVPPKPPFEVCEVNDPQPGSYYVAVHNFGDTSAPSTTTDDVTIEIAVIGERQLDDNGRL